MYSSYTQNNILVDYIIHLIINALMIHDLSLLLLYYQFIITKSILNQLISFMNIAYY
jgi:hypothetical protein